MAIAEHLIWPAADVSSAESARAAARTARVYFLMLAAFGFAALVLGIENRLTPALFPVAPPVDLVPPLGDQAWYRAFALHQQDPVFAACGGSESLAQFQVLYWWEWLRRGSLLLLAGTILSGFFTTALWPAYRFALQRHAALGLGALGYLAAVWCLNVAVAHVEDLARYNVGQYRHALDMTFASVALAFVLACAITPPAATVFAWRRAGWVWIALIVLDICSGALFASRDAISVWRSFPGYETGVLPPLERLTDYAPPWLNFTFNQYMIQLVHRVVSIGLWLGLLANVIWSWIRTGRRDGRAMMGAAVLCILMTVEMAAGIATLALGGSATVTFLHEIGAVLLLAVAVVVLTPRGSIP